MDFVTHCEYLYFPTDSLGCLTIPDIAGAAESEDDGRATFFAYPKWFDSHIQPQFGKRHYTLTGQGRTRTTISVLSLPNLELVVPFTSRGGQGGTPRQGKQSSLCCHLAPLPSLRPHDSIST